VVRPDAGGGGDPAREVPFGALRFAADGGSVTLILEEGSPR
jgi:hypothetical protein